MRKYLIIGIAAFFGGIEISEAQLNMTLLGSKTYNEELSDIWGYVDSLGNEYALVGAQDGVSIVDVTDPANPVEIWWFTGAFTTWRDIKVWNKHCYVTNESSGGLFIIDLSGLPDTSAPATATYTGSAYPFGSAHNIFIDENGVAYIMGSNYSEGGAIMLDVDTDPLNPIELGVFDTYYLHDGMARGDTLWGGAINDGFFVIVDVSSKANPIVLGTKKTPSTFTHNCWISDDNKTLYTTDEKAYAFIGAYDVSDVGNIIEVGRIRSNPGSGTIPHNTHFMNDYIITSYYRDGVTVHDVTYPDNMIEVANYDTYAGSGNGFNGAWGVYPWLPSGNILVTNIEDGLTVHGINYIRGCYLHGTVTDLFTGNPIANATIKLLTTLMGGVTDIAGDYKTGIATANTYSVEFSAPGYYSDTLTAILTNGTLTVLDVQLSSLPSFAQPASVVSSSGDPISGVTVNISNNEFDFTTTTDASGNVNMPTFYAGTYNVLVGKWGYITYCEDSVNIDDLTGALSYSLQSGYEDDFALDLGWINTTSAPRGVWERGEPLGTTYGGDPAAPDEDVQGGCSDKAYITGNTGIGVGDDDVDQGFTEIRSPAMNLFTYTDPYIEYYRWFFNAAGNGPIDDTLRISLTDGTTTVVVEKIGDSLQSGSWIFVSFRVSDYIALSSTMRIIVQAGDDTLGAQNLVEAGFDAFKVVEYVTVPQLNQSEFELSAFPNPFSETVSLSYDLKNITQSGEIVLRDLTGRIILSKVLRSSKGEITINSKVAKGIYMVELRSGGQVLKTLKVIKA